MTARRQRLFEILAGPVAPKVRATQTTINTSWIVVTGAPGAGKSTVCSELEKAGHRIVPEASRAAITEAVAKGFPVEEIFADGALLSECILIRKLAIAQSLTPTDLWIWDTGLGDALVFCQLATADVAKFTPELLSYRFRRVVLLEPLAANLLSRDVIRPQTEAQRTQLHTRLAAEYEAQGYIISRISSGASADRMTKIRELLR